MKKIICFCLVLLLLAGCGAQTVKLELAEVYADIGKRVALPDMLELDEGMMLDYCGIRSEDVSQAVVLICADSLKTDEIWLLEAVDAKAADRLMELAEGRLAQKGEESITYSPEQYKVHRRNQQQHQG